MNNFIIKQSERVGPCTFLISEKLRVDHLNLVLKSQVDDKIKVLLPDTGMTIAVIERLNSDSVQLRVGEFCKKSLPWINLLVGLSRPPTCKKIIEHGTTSGVANFRFFKAQLSDKSYATAKIFRDKKYQISTDFGLSQSGIYYKNPQLTVEERPLSLSELKAIPSQKFVLSLNGKKSFLDYPLDFTSPFTVAIGPERGWTEKEEQEFTQAGFQSVTISESILRVEIACFYSLAQLEMLKLNKTGASHD